MRPVPAVVHAPLPLQPGPKRAATGAHAAHNRRPAVRPAIGIIFLIIGGMAHRRIVALAVRWRLPPAGPALHRPPGSHDPGERTCSQCKMSARAAGSRRPSAARQVWCCR